MCLGLTLSCNDKSDNKHYTLIRDNLYKDEAGNLYFKAIDRSNKKEGETVRYLDVVYSEKFGIKGIKKMGDVIDEDTFKYNSEKDIYTDKNHTYKFNIMVDGGTISIEE